MKDINHYNEPERIDTLEGIDTKSGKKCIVKCIKGCGYQGCKQHGKYNCGVRIVDKNNIRFKKAEEQSKKHWSGDIKKDCRDKINELLKNSNCKETAQILSFYKGETTEEQMQERVQDLCKFYNIPENQIIWMKFTTTGQIGAVARSNDINFRKPTREKDYNKRELLRNYYGNYDPIYNTSGILLHYCGLEWDKSEIVVVPILNEHLKNFKVGDFENSIGNMLEDEGFPVIDYYSHNF